MPTLFQAVAETQDWEHQEPVLGTVAKLAELSPAHVNTYVEDRPELVDKLIEHCSNLYSISSRCFALTALSYLRHINPDGVPGPGGCGRASAPARRAAQARG